MRAEKSQTGFVKSEEGTVAILWAISLVAFVGFIAIVFDIGRISVTQSELQTFVDHVALASASELDGQAGAVNDATLAANALIADSHTFGLNSGANNTNGTILSGNGVDFSLRFLRAIPDDDTAPIRNSDVIDPNSSSRDAEAAFIEVTAIPHSVDMPFFGALRALLAQGTGTPQSLVSATAIAGAGTEICDVPPIFYCRPNQVVNGTSVPRSLTDPKEFGTMVRLRTGGGAGSSWGPGNFGFLDPTKYVDPQGPCKDANGLSKIIGCMIGAEQGISTCVSTRGVTTDTGQSVGITDAAWNVRFDMFEATTNKYKNTDGYTAAPNIGAGLKTPANGCHPNNPAVSPNTIQLPKDAIFSDATKRFSAPQSDFTTAVTSVTFNKPGTSDPYLGPNGMPVIRNMTPMERYIIINHNDGAQPTPNGATGLLTQTQIDNELLNNRLGYTFGNTPGTGSFATALGTTTEATTFLADAKAAFVEASPGGTVAPVTRFEIYLREIAWLQAAANTSSNPKKIVYGPHYRPSGLVAASLSESGVAQCTNRKSSDPFRRVIVAAEIDCGSVALNGKKTVRPSGFTLMFLTEPVGNDGSSPPSFDIWGEVLGNAKFGFGGASDAGGRIRDVVRLYR